MKSPIFRPLSAIVAIFLFDANRTFSAPSDPFPYSIPVQIGASEFAPGDNIQITSISGDRPHLETGGSYRILGTYTLASADSSGLMASVTSNGPSASTPILPGETMTVARGTATFSLTKKFQTAGWLHVSFYVNGTSHGGVYFGEAGVEATVLKQKGWSDFRPSGPTRSSSAVSAFSSSSPANAALARYLGDPVSSPADLDGRYTPSGLLRAVRTLAANSGWELRSVSVDDSEFPNLVYGAFSGEHRLEDIKSRIATLPGYTYAGSSTVDTPQATFFAMNITPADAYPSDDRKAISRRLMVRLQMLMNRAQQREEGGTRENENTHRGGIPAGSTENAAGARHMPGT